MQPKKVGMFVSALGLVMALALAPSVAQAQTGTVNGKVTAQGTGEALGGALIFLVGTNRSVTSNEEGNYVIRDVSAGDVTIQVVTIGYRSFAATFRLAAGGSHTADFELPAVVLSMDAIVVTASGEQRAREVSNSIARIDVADAAPEVMPQSMAQMIQGRASGVQIINSSGTAGTGTKIRIRGSSSVSLSNAPLLVVDGVRVESGENSSNIGVGGQTISRINDFNPDDIESIEIVKGPSAAALYGTAAANGVIVIHTKQGQVGRPIWSAYIEQGTVNEVSDFPDNFRGIDATGGSCRVANLANGSCTAQAGFEIANPLESKTVSPIDNGNRQQYGINVRGGSEDVQYFVSGEWQVENGIFHLPDGTQDSIRAAGGTIPDFADNPNRLERASVRANLTARLGQKANLRMSTGFVSSDNWLPQNDNNVLGLLPSGLLGGTDSTRDGGWRFFTPEEIFFIEGKQAVERFTGSADLSWRPTYWLEGHATGGIDFTERRDIRFNATGTGPSFSTFRQGDRRSNSRSIWQYSLDVGATAQFQLSSSLSSKTSVAAQYFRNNVEQITTTGQILPPGARSNASASQQFIGEAFIESRTLGVFIEQTFGLNDRLFINAAVRADDNSAFGKDFSLVTYPKFGASFVAMEDRGGLLDNLRFRAAFGASGQQPGSNSAQKFFGGTSVIDDGGEVVGVTIQNAGNNNLKPERSEEIEFGFDAGLLNNRVGLEFTYYDRSTTDALISRTLAPSIGLTTTFLDNIGETSNSGIEVAINAAILEGENLGWDMSISGSTNSNQVDKLGEGVEPIRLGDQSFRENRPLGAWFSRTFTFDDANNDGLIAASEITYSDTTEFIGYPRPRYEISFFNAFTLGQRFRISGLFDYRGGHKQYNLTEAFRCGFNICRAINDPTSSLADQAAAESRRTGPGVSAGFIEDAWFIKMRELSFTFFFPDSWANALRFSRVNLAVTGRNLFTITDYRGLDPEVQGQTGDFTGRDFLTQPQVRSWTARLNLTF